MGAPSSSIQHDPHTTAQPEMAEDSRKPPAKAKVISPISTTSTIGAAAPTPEEEEESKIPAKVLPANTTLTSSSCDTMSLTSSMKVTTRQQQGEQPERRQRRPRYVTFGATTTVLHDTSLTSEERDLCFHDPDELKKRTKSEIQLARRYYRKTGPHHRPNSNTSKGFCYRGLEKRMQSTDVQKRKWYSFLQSFLALQHDLQKLEGDTTNLLAVFVSTHSKTDLALAYQMGRQDEAVAFRIYDTPASASATTTSPNSTTNKNNDGATEGRRLHLSSNSSNNRNDTISILKPSNSKSNLRNGGGGSATTTTTTAQPPSAPPQPKQQQGCHLARKA